MPLNAVQKPCKENMNITGHAKQTSKNIKRVRIYRQLHVRVNCKKKKKHTQLRTFTCNCYKIDFIFTGKFRDNKTYITKIGINWGKND